MRTRRKGPTQSVLFVGQGRGTDILGDWSPKCCPLGTKVVWQQLYDPDAANLSYLQGASFSFM